MRMCLFPPVTLQSLQNLNHLDCYLLADLDGGGGRGAEKMRGKREKRNRMEERKRKRKEKISENQHLKGNLHFQRISFSLSSGKGA